MRAVIPGLSYPDYTVGSGISPDRTPKGVSRTVPPVGNRTPPQDQLIICIFILQFGIAFVNSRGVILRFFLVLCSFVQKNVKNVIIDKFRLPASTGFFLRFCYHCSAVSFLKGLVVMENSKDRNRKSKSRGFAGGSVNKTNVRSGAPAASKGKMPAGASARQEKRSAEGGERLRRAPKNIRFARSAAIGCAKTANAASVLKETVSKIPYSAIAGGARILAAFFVGMLFSRRDMLFSTYPLAIAGVSAFGEQLVPFAVGAFAGGVSTGDTGYVYSAVCVIITAVRLFLSLYEREKKNARAAFFDQPLKVRLYIAALGAFFCGIYCIIRNEYRYYRGYILQNNKECINGVIPRVLTKPCRIMPNERNVLSGIVE